MDYHQTDPLNMGAVMAGAAADTIYRHLDHIDKVNEKNLYEYYLDTIYNNQPMIHVFGNVDSERINQLCHKYLLRDNFEDKPMDIKLMDPVRMKDEPSYVEEDSDFRNSCYTIMYNVKDMKEDERILLETVRSLLSSQATRLLSKKLRDEHELVYSAYAFEWHPPCIPPCVHAWGCLSRGRISCNTLHGRGQACPASTPHSKREVPCQSACWRFPPSGCHGRYGDSIDALPTGTAWLPHKDHHPVRGSSSCGGGCCP